MKNRNCYMNRVITTSWRTNLVSKYVVIFLKSYVECDPIVPRILNYSWVSKILKLALSYDLCHLKMTFIVRYIIN